MNEFDLRVRNFEPGLKAHGGFVQPCHVDTDDCFHFHSLTRNGHILLR